MLGLRIAQWLLVWAVLFGGLALPPTAGAQPFVTEFTLPTAGANLQLITVGPDGNLWFTELTGNQIGRITPAGVITEFPIPTVDSGPVGITAGPDGNLWFTEGNTNQIGRITPAGDFEEFSITTPSAGAFGITAGPDGNVWFTEQTANKIGRITPAGVVTEFSVPTAASEPIGIVAGPDGNLWFTEAGGNKIGRITPAGAITEFPVPTPASVPAGITAGPDGNVWFTEIAGNKVGRLTPAFVSISPRSGFLSTTQQFDLTLTIDTAGLAVVGGQALFEGADIGAALLPCLVFGTRLSGGQTVRCPGLTGGLFGTGVHTMTITLFLSDGSVVSDTAEWHVQANSEP